MKKKRDIVTRQVYKWKAGLNMHGGQQYYVVNYLDTYSPVVNWLSISTLLTMAAINKCHSSQVDFIQACLQAPIDYELYMELPKGFKTKEGDRSTHVLKLLNNLYGQNQAGQVWNHHLNDALRQVIFKQSSVDECVRYKNKTIFFYCVDYGIFMGPESKSIDRAIKEIEKAGLDIEDKVNIEDYMGVNIKDKDNGNINLTQPQIINSVINNTQILNNTAPRQMPDFSAKILRCDAASPPFDERFNYRAVVGNLNLH